MIHDRSDAIVVTQTFVDSRPARRVMYEPRADGRYDRTEQVRTGCGNWRTVGTERICDVMIELPEGQTRV